MTQAATPLAPARRRRAAGPRSIPEIDHRLAAAARLQAQIQELEKQLVEHRAWLLDYLQEGGHRSASLGGFTAHLRSRSNWEYSPRLEAEMLRIRHDQKVEQTEGVATNRPTPYVALVFKG